ncbi:tyrosine-type recombinase/integrase [Xanthobacteraceae bacterium Astr-EGSB]|uniref:tyrosine-type recombinase/integrase n=1 Tax=Astrobacterium formosum TaxID=3069710 RepID=UPI0027B28C81|nr:tyrosine-type recombinase/integrase [Xanthobacteraceae bacterium Astr-EGSB]
MSVYRHRNSPFWQFDFQRAGYRFSGTTGIPASRPRREAEHFEADQKKAAERLVSEIRASGRQPLTLGAACDRWWDEVGQHLAERGTLEPALAFLKETIGSDRHLHSLTDDDVLRAMAARRKSVKRSGRDHKGKQLYHQVSPRTVNKTVPLLLRRIVRRARELWRVVVIDEPKWGKLCLDVPKRQTPEISLAQEAAIDAAERDDYHAVRKFAAINGLRLKECLLTWPQVDFDNALVRVIAKGKEPRTVPLSKAAYALLWAERGRHPEFVFTYVAARTQRRGKPGERIRGERYPLTTAGISSNRKRHWPVAARFHDWRHTAGRRTLRATGNLKIVQTMLGHADIKTTSEFYADVLVDDVRRAMDLTAVDVESRKKSRNAGADKGKPMKTSGK